MLRTTNIATIFSSPAITTTSDSTLAQVRDLMDTHHINHVPVVDQAGLPLGVVSRVDLNQVSSWRSRFDDLKGKAEKVDKQLFGSLLAGEIMSSPVITIAAGALVEGAAELIERHHVHCLPVIDTTGKIVGILTAHDLLRLAYLK